VVLISFSLPALGETYRMVSVALNAFNATIFLKDEKAASGWFS
jgi:hypothetical protein